MHTGTIYLLILLSILDLILLNADTYYSINSNARLKFITNVVFTIKLMRDRDRERGVYKGWLQPPSINNNMLDARSMLRCCNNN